MDRSTAIALFTSLDDEKITDLEGDPPQYDVRLDASIDREGERTYRVRVTGGSFGLDRDAWLFVIEQAGEHEVEVEIQNSGMELR